VNGKETEDDADEEDEDDIPDMDDFEEDNLAEAVRMGGVDNTDYDEDNEVGKITFGIFFSRNKRTLECC